MADEKLYHGGHHRRRRYWDRCEDLLVIVGFARPEVSALVTKEIIFSFETDGEESVHLHMLSLGRRLSDPGKQVTVMTATIMDVKISCNQNGFFGVVVQPPFSRFTT
jgi:hypothetical protein